MPIESNLTPICHCPCSCYKDGITGIDIHESVRLADGQIALRFEDLSLRPYNFPFKIERSYANKGGMAESRFGSNWLVEDLPNLVASGSSVKIEKGPDEVLHFTEVTSGVYEADFFIQDKLAYNSTDDEYTLTNPDGKQQIFDGTSGDLIGLKDAYGHSAVVNYDGSSNLEKIEFAHETGGGSGSLEFTFTGSEVTKVLLKNGTTEVKQALYTYSSGKLETVKIQEKSSHWTGWKDVSKSYYKYDGSGRLKYVVGNKAYEQVDSVGNPPETASDSTLDQYADFKFTYDGSSCVSRVDVMGGKYDFTSITYTDSTRTTDNMNTWKQKTSVTRPDGSKVIYYFNKHGQVMLRTIQNSGGTQKWHTGQKFSSNGRLEEQVKPSAVNAINESSDGLFTIHSSTGLIQLFSYDANNNLEYEAIKNGSSGVVTKQKEYTYEAHTVSGVSIYRVKTEKVYRESSIFGASDDVTTTYTYTRYTGTFEIQKRVTTLPAVVSGENGSGVFDTVEHHYDSYGFLTKYVDGRGTETTYEYDNATGSMTKKTEDAAVGGLQLVTDYTLDDLGRVTEELGPEHTIDLNGTATAIRRAKWTYFKDDVDQRWTINGYEKVSDGSETAENPIHILKMDVDDGSGGLRDEEITAKYSSSGKPASTHSFSQSDYQSWHTSHYDKGRELTKAREYHSIPTSGTGSSGTNYNESTFSYDTAGRQNEVKSPEGTINKTTYSLMGWPEKDEVGTTSGNLITVTEYEHDDDTAGGDGLLTKVTQVINAGSDDRVIDYTYDWRHRNTEIESTDSSNVFIEKLTYDNRLNVKKRERFKTSTSSSNRLDRTDIEFDALSRVYQEKVYAVNSSGTTGNSLETNYFYDSAGNLSRIEHPEKDAVTVHEFDDVGRTTQTAIGQISGSGASGYDPSDLSGVKVMDQQESDFDDAGNVILQTTRQRFDDATAAGALVNKDTNPKARVSFVAIYPDALGRTQAVADYGTYAGSSFTRATTLPTRSDTILVTETTYDDAGNVQDTIDPKDITTRREYDDAGRQTKLIEDYSAGSSLNRTTRYEYNGEGNLEKLIVENSTTGNQETEWSYGVTTGNGSDINSKSLVYQKIHASGAAESDTTTFKYNRQGQVKEMSDPRSVVRQFDFDELGRITADKVTSLPAGVDGAVRRIENSFDAHGRLEKVTSYNASSGGSVVNEVQYAFNDFDQLTTEYQEHSGAVNTSTSKKVQYAYANGSSNTIRRTSMTYPDNKVLTYDYGTSGGSNDELGRVEKIKDGSTVVTSYRYLGLSSVIGVKYEEAGNTELTYESGSTGDAGDKYDGIDRFGRIVDNRWVKSSTNKQRTKYGYDRAGNRIWREDLVNTSNEDNYITYDNVYQIDQFKRGNLNAGKTGLTGTAAAEEDLAYDPSGNWTSYVEKASGSTTLNQTRTHNKVNEITNMTNPSSVVDPTYDAVGNTTKVNKPGEWTTAYDLTWDAWNRLVEVEESSTTIATYAYDGTHRRVEKTTSGTQHFYYNDAWQIVEEYDGSTSDKRYWWGVRHLNDITRRDSGTSLSTKRFALHDIMNVASIIDTSGNVQLSMAYRAFGEPRFLSGNNGTEEWTFFMHGHYGDAETGFYQMRHRYYNSDVGRWLSRDPILEDGGINLYLFTGNAPSALFDPLGLEPEDDQASGSLLSVQADANKNHNCGRFDFKRRFKLKPKPANGHVIQFVFYQHSSKRCRGGLMPGSKVGNFAKSFIEAFPVKNGKATPDIFREKSHGGEGTCGAAIIYAVARFHEGLNALPGGMKRNRDGIPSGDSPATPNVKRWNDFKFFPGKRSNIVAEQYTFTWACCKNRPRKNEVKVTAISKEQAQQLINGLLRNNEDNPQWEGQPHQPPPIPATPKPKWRFRRFGRFVVPIPVR